MDMDGNFDRHVCPNWLESVSEIKIHSGPWLLVELEMTVQLQMRYCRNVQGKPHIRRGSGSTDIL